MSLYTPEHITEADAFHALAGLPDTGDGIAWLAARTSGLYCSSDEGGTWQDAYAGLKLEAPLTTASVALSPDYLQDTKVYAGALGGILRSTDGGKTWSVSTLPTPPPFVVSLVVSPNFAHDGLVFAGTLEDGVFRSWDRGETWASWNFGLLDLNVYCLIASPNFVEDDTLYVGTESGVFRSANGGRAWREIDFPMEYSPVLSLAISPAYMEDRMLLAGTEEHGVFRSDDGGDSWSATDITGSVGPVNQLLQSSSFSNPFFFAVTNSSVFGSNDGIGQWHSLFSIEKDIDTQISAVALVDSETESRLLIATSDGSIQTVSRPATPA